MLDSLISVVRAAGDLGCCWGIMPRDTGLRQVELFATKMMSGLGHGAAALELASRE